MMRIPFPPQDPLNGELGRARNSTVSKTDPNRGSLETLQKWQGPEVQLNRKISADKYIPTPTILSPFPLKTTLHGM